MINAYNSTLQTVNSGETVKFDTNRIKTGCAATHLEGSPVFRLNRAGYYYVSFNAVISSSTAGNITLQLRNGANLIPGAIAIVNITADTDIQDVSFSTIIKVPPSCCAVDNSGNLSIVVTGTATITAPNIVIKKIS